MRRRGAAEAGFARWPLSVAGAALATKRTESPTIGAVAEDAIEQAAREDETKSTTSSAMTLPPRSTSTRSRSRSPAR